MVMLEISPATSQFEERSVKLSLPIWVWKYFEARANTCHGGNLEEALGFFFNFSFAEFIQSGAVKAAIPVNEN